ncbi:MAG: DNA helicase PriA [Flavobacteriaceae bacterium]|nr:DNA helicase PriA [Flavobacteriaceae bacterium]
MEYKQKTAADKKSCANCGAEMKYKPGSEQLACEYCGYEEFIAQEKSSFEELELDHYLQTVGNNVFTDTIDMIDCKHCGANQHIEENYKTLSCVYCGEPLLIADAHPEGWIKPGAVVPFQLDVKKARRAFKKWIGGVWFAPNKLKKAALDPEAIHGLYLPYWTFDAQCKASYTGQRGDYYYVTETYRSNGKTQTRQVRKTRWSQAAGNVSGFIDDILISASAQKQNQIPSKISRWNLKSLVPFDGKFLAGFVTEKYTVSLKDGHHSAFQRAKKITYDWIRADIGGDTQRISSADMSLSEETFKHILLPIYISAYKFKGKTYRFYVNGQTGQVSGKHPYSFWKIFFLVITILIAIGILAMFAQQ